MKTLYQQLEAYFAKHANAWHHKGTLQRMEWRDKRGHLYETDNVSRRLRELEEDHIIAVRYEKAMAVYRFIPPPYRDHYVDAKERGQYRNEPMWKGLAKKSETQTLSAL